MKKRSVKIAHLSDVHMTDTESESFRGANTYANYIKVLDDINSEHFDCIIATGDMSETGSLESYRLLKHGLSEIIIPVYIIPGNHDNPENMKVFLEKNLLTYENKISFRNWELYFLNTVVDNENYGYVSGSDFQKFFSNIKNSTAKNVGIIMHHQPINVGTPLIDRLNLQNAFILDDLLLSDSRIKLALFGHVHNDYEFSKDNILYSSAPATCFQFKKGTIKLDIEYKFGYKIYEIKNDQFISSIRWFIT